MSIYGKYKKIAASRGSIEPFLGKDFKIMTRVGYLFYNTVEHTVSHVFDNYLITDKNKLIKFNDIVEIKVKMD